MINAQMMMSCNVIENNMKAISMKVFSHVNHIVYETLGFIN